MDNYTFRREFDFSTNFPELIAELKNSRQFRKVDLARKYELYDSFYKTVKEFYLSDYVSAEEKQKIEDVATQRLMERGLQELEKTLQQ